MMERFFQDKSGSTAIEYAFIAMLIGLVLITALLAMGENLNGFFQDAAAGMGGEQAD